MTDVLGQTVKMTQEYLCQFKTLSVSIMPEPNLNSYE